MVENIRSLSLVVSLRFNRAVVPQGTYLAPEEIIDDPRRIAAIKRTQILGARLAEEHPEIANLYRDTVNSPTYFDIAAEFIPDTLAQNPMFASRVVGYAVRSLIPQEEQERLTSERRSKTFKAALKALGEEGYREHQRNANLARNSSFSSVDAMIRGRGQIPWDVEEKAMVYEAMISDPKYQRQEGHLKGTPDYAKIAYDINLIYHEGKPVRTGRLMGIMVRDERRKRKKRMQQINQ